MKKSENISFDQSHMITTSQSDGNWDRSGEFFDMFDANEEMITDHSPWGFSNPRDEGDQFTGEATMQGMEWIVRESENPGESFEYGVENHEILFSYNDEDGEVVTDLTCVSTGDGMCRILPGRREEHVPA